MKKIKEYLDGMLRDLPGRAGLYYEDLTSGESALSLHGQE